MNSSRRRSTATMALSSLLMLSAGASGCAAAAGPPAPDFPCDADNGGITLPDGFCATVFADGLGMARHVAVNDNGDVYVARGRQGRRGADGQREITSAGGVVGLRDADGDGKAEVIEQVSEVAGSGLAIHGGHLYYADRTQVFRVALTPGELVPQGEHQLIVSGFPEQGQHATKPMTFDGAGNMYVTVGAPSNACQERMRTPGSPGLDPCPQLDLQAGIWRFDAARPGQIHGDDGQRYATGIRNGFALDWNRDVDALYTVQHGRDSLSELYPDLYTPEQRAELPSEEMFAVAEGDDFGWPYCYHDPALDTKVLAPEYGGDGRTPGRCAGLAPTLIAFPAHWAPNDLLFYRGGTFPARYDNGAFVAFHGSWNRMPFPQQGYNVVFVPFREGRPDGDLEVFAAGFAGTDEVRMPGDAVYRPTGLAQGADGSLYITDSRTGRIWRVRADSGGTDGDL